MSARAGIISVAALLFLAVAAWLAFGFFGIQSAFLDNEVDEGGPVFTSAVESAEDVEESGGIAEATEAEQDTVAATAEFQEAMTEAEENRTETDESMEDMDDDMPGEIITVYSGSFSGESRYEIVGNALVLNDGSEQRFLRFEEFSSSNGPDLKVYLRADSGDFVSLGPLKGNIGDQNYEIPTDVDLDVFSQIQIWCERFGVNFGGAALSAA